jgi:polyisoprenoid-binding protein YceI
MKKLTMSILSLAFVFAAVAGNDTKKESVMTVSPAESSVEWLGKKVTGKHNGEVKVRQGNIVLDERGQIKSAYVQVDMQTITCEDLKDPETNAKLVGHLKSDDFFSVEKFPYAEIKLNKFESGKERGTYTASGDLTIKGKTHPISIPFTYNAADGKMTASGSFTFDRSDYDVRYGSTSFFDNLGDKAIYDDVQLDFTVVGMAKK